MTEDENEMSDDPISEHVITVTLKFRGTESDYEAMQDAAIMADESLYQMASELGVEIL